MHHTLRYVTSLFCAQNSVSSSVETHDPPTQSRWVTYHFTARSPTLESTSTPSII
jgi:hypothetical protein